MASASVVQVQQRGLRGFLLSLRRHTTSGLYVPELDGLRFIAIVLVFIYHVNLDVSPPGNPHPDSSLYALSANLNIGVPLFFALSGMILGLPLARYWLKGGAPVSIKRYFMRRLTRLEPPYIIALLLMFTLKRIGHHGTIPEMLPHLSASLVYLHNLIYRQMSSISSVAWSLEVEVQFYILAPVLAMIFAVRAPWLRRAIILGAIIAAAIWTPYDVKLTTPTNTAAWMRGISVIGNIQYFLTGFLLAEAFLLIPPATSRRRWWDLVSLAGWPLLAVGLVTAKSFVLTALPLIFLPLCLAAFYGPDSARLCGRLWIASIGGMCYSIYLLHSYAIVLIGMVTERIGRGLPFDARLVIQLVIMMPIVLAVCTVFYRLVEQPCMYPDWPAHFMAFVRNRWRSLTTVAEYDREPAAEPGTFSSLPE
jgi:peptidoglycan/LPS O-acetylase OafA/YrhL